MIWIWLLTGTAGTLLAGAILGVVVAEVSPTYTDYRD